MARPAFLTGGLALRVSALRPAFWICWALRNAAGRIGTDHAVWLLLLLGVACWPQPSSAFPTAAAKACSKPAQHLGSRP